MDMHLIFWPMLAQMTLTLGMFIVLAARKARAVASGSADLRQTALNNRAWPDDVVKVSNNIANQFETPILFYGLCLILAQLDAITVVALTLSWAYVATRVIHALIHVNSNYVPMRLRFFAASMVILLALMLVAFWEIANLQLVGS